MDYTATKSDCQLCGREFSGKGMGRHLSTCVEKHAPKDANTLAKRYCYLSVRDAYNRDYFLFLLVAQKATLQDLDDYLRATWLECCGHMSAFSYGKWGREIPMTTPIQQICDREDLAYVYDFGSSTELQIKIFKEVKNADEIKQDIILLARNGQPQFPCDECGDYPATTICTDCQWEGGGWLCEKCITAHDCDEEMFIPVVNSPRAGVCAYDGSDDDELFENPPELISQEDEKTLRELLGHAVDPKEALTYHELCGFLFGLTITPEVVMVSEWLPIVFGEEMLEFDSEEQGQSYMNCLMRVYNQLTMSFHEGELLCPIPLAQLKEDAPDVREWVFGLHEALNLRLDYWLEEDLPQRLTREQEELTASLAVIRALVDPLFYDAFFGVDTDREMDDPQMTPREELLVTLPAAVMTLVAHGYHLEMERQRNLAGRIPGPPQPLRSEKIGRNDPCPCGSGKKYKKCCLNT